MKSKHKIGDLVMSYDIMSQTPVLGQITDIKDYPALGDDSLSYRVRWFTSPEEIEDEYGVKNMERFAKRYKEYKKENGIE